MFDVNNDLTGEDMGSVGLEVVAGLAEALTEVKKSRGRPMLNRKTLDRINELAQELGDIKNILNHIGRNDINVSIANVNVKAKRIYPVLESCKNNLILELKQLGYEEEENGNDKED